MIFLGAWFNTCIITHFAKTFIYITRPCMQSGYSAQLCLMRKIHWLYAHCFGSEGHWCCIMNKYSNDGYSRNIWVANYQIYIILFLPFLNKLKSVVLEWFALSKYTWVHRSQYFFMLFAKDISSSFQVVRTEHKPVLFNSIIYFYAVRKKMFTL